MSLGTFMLIGAAIGLLFYFLVQSWVKKSNEKIYETLKKNNFFPYKEIFFDKIGRAIFFNKKTKEFAIFPDTHQMIRIPFDKIIEIKVDIDNNVSSLSKIVGGAIILGAPGALLGAISGKKPKYFDIIFVLNDLDNPSLRFRLNYGLINDSDLDRYKKVVDDILGIFQILDHKNKAGQ